jgi:16S rRNA C967 or C1407 C5-methylase (RsmB/RsmF family)
MSARAPATLPGASQRASDPAGKVYANDIEPRMLDLLRHNLEQRHISNVEPVLGAVDDPSCRALRWT